MGTEKRERQKAARQARIEAELRADQRQRRNRSILRIIIIGAIIVGAVVLYSLLTGGDDETVGSGAGTDTTALNSATTFAPSTTAAPTTAAPATTAVSPDSQYGEGECPALDGSSETRREFDDRQPLCIDLDQKYVTAFSTSVGDFDVLIDPDLDPVSANNFVTLALWHAYDDVIFHRIINQFVVQGGDVAGLDGLGDAGYKFTGGVPQAGQYRLGSIAMANSGRSDSNGSQFFIVTGPSGQGLPPLYSLFGQVITGIDVPLTMQGVETGPGDKPIDDVVINSIDVRVATADDIAAYESLIGG